MQAYKLLEAIELAEKDYNYMYNGEDVCILSTYNYIEYPDTLELTKINFRPISNKDPHYTPMNSNKFKELLRKNPTRLILIDNEKVIGVQCRNSLCLFTERSSVDLQSGWGIGIFYLNNNLHKVKNNYELNNLLF